MAVLLNWLVQGLIVAIAAAAGLRVIPASRAQARYGFIWAAYLLVLALPVISLVSTGAIDPRAVDRASGWAGPVLTMPAAWWTSPAAAVGLWIVWSGIHALQLVIGTVELRQAKRWDRPCPRDVLARLPHWSRLNAIGRPTRVVLSNRVRFAAVLGCGSPVVALAPALIEQLTAADLDRVLVHEWAHVQRRDDIAQLVQRFGRMIVGWHPAAWWLERQLDFEREAACDAVAVAVTGSARGYATCLAALAALPRAPIRPLPALAALSSSGLRRRLVRILASPRVGGARPRRASTICAAVGLAALGLNVGNVRAVASASTQPTRQSAAQPASAEPAAIGVSGTSVSIARAASSVKVVAPPRLRSDGRGRSAMHEHDAPGEAAEVRTIEALPTPAMPSLPLRSMEWAAGILVSTPLARPAQEAVGLDATAPAADVSRPAADRAPAPWTVAADAGRAMGRLSQSAGVATAGFFSRFGKTINRSF